jgi:excinuclease ABC subunit A
VKDQILVRGARQNNLKGFDVAIPRRRLTVITGPSGSGKSSLAFDTVYAEGQRRYVESLSAYARQFLERMEKPDVDGVDGVSPAVAIEQKNPTRTSRSTVGTSTEVYDYLRLLWARIGRTFCPRCGRELKPDTVQTVTDTLLTLEPGERFLVGFPLKLSAKVTDTMAVENLRAQGFLRVAINGDVRTLEEVESEKLSLVRAERLVVVVDRLSADRELQGRIAEAVGTAFRDGDGECVVLRPEARGQRAEARGQRAEGGGQSRARRGFGF